MAAIVKSLASILFSYESVPLHVLRRDSPVEGQLEQVPKCIVAEKVISTCPSCIPFVDPPSDIAICPPLGPVDERIKDSVAACSTRSVSFDLTKVVVYEITPYSEVYNGVHPKDFQFGKGLPAPAACFYDPSILPHPIITTEGWRKRCEEDEESSDSDDDDELPMQGSGNGLRYALQRPAKTLRSLPPPALFTLVLMCLLVRAFGAQTLLGAAMPEFVAKGSPLF